MELIKLRRVIIHIFFLFSLITSFEDKESLSKRINFYRDTRKYSNNAIIEGYSPEKGLFCVANDYLEYGQITFKIPRHLSMCGYYLFPFKFELVSYLREIKELEDTVGYEQKFSIYVLTYYLLYFSSDRKEEVKAYIKSNKLEQYYNLEEPDESFLESFPKMLLNSAFLEHEHYALFEEYGFSFSKLNELEIIYNHVLKRVIDSEHFEVMLPWVKGFQKFKWAYSIVMSRSMTLRYKEYMILDNTVEKMKNYTKWDEINNDLNKYFSKNSGCACLIAKIDLCNHYQPKFHDGRDKRLIILDTVYDNFINYAAKTYNRGEEVSYTYITDPFNISLFLHYGFILPNNIFDSVIIRLTLENKFTKDQLSLCKELGCVDISIRNPSNLPSTRESTFRNGQINQFLINYGRVKNLKSPFDYKTYLKILSNDKPISFENEVSAWMFYASTVKLSIVEKLEMYKQIVFRAQKYRNKCKALEENWEDDDEQRNTWMNNKTYENIHLISCNLLNIVLKNIYGGYNKIIYHTKNELNNIRNKYLSE